MAEIMSTFHWPVKPGMTVDMAPKVMKMQFGDGYAQRRPAGLNAQLKKYTITVKVARADAGALQDFLSRHGGVKAFLWTPPFGHREIRVVCGQWKAAVGAVNTVITATFEEVV